MSVAIQLLASLASLSRFLIFWLAQKLLTLLTSLKLISFIKSTQIDFVSPVNYLIVAHWSFLAVFYPDTLLVVFKTKNAGKKKGEGKKKQPLKDKDRMEIEYK